MSRNRDISRRIAERFDSLDPTSRQGYLLKLVRERGFFRTVFNTLEEGILVIDLSLHIRYANSAAVELLALPEDFSGIGLPRLLHEVDFSRILPPDGAHFERSYRQEIEVLYPESRYVQFCLVPLEEASDTAVVILRDVTEHRKKTMKELERETANAVSMLAAGVAHEIGNPLNSLFLNLQILEEEMSATPCTLSSEEQLESIRSCRGEVERLDHILTRFLSAVRPGHPKFAPVDLREIVIDTLNFMRREVEARSVEVRCDWPEAIPPVPGDANSLKQAFYNILKNALQATPPGGIIRIRCYVAEEGLTLEFQDSGKGMTPEELSSIFTPFKTFREGGNGLGMMIIERICREHGVELSVDSKEGQGTMLTLRFCRRKPRVRVLSAPRENGEDAHAQD